MEEMKYSDNIKGYLFMMQSERRWTRRTLQVRPPSYIRMTEQSPRRPAPQARSPSQLWPSNPSVAVRDAMAQRSQRQRGTRPSSPTNPTQQAALAVSHNPAHRGWRDLSLMSNKMSKCHYINQLLTLTSFSCNLSFSFFPQPFLSTVIMKGMLQ